MVTLLYISPPKKKFVNFSRSKYKEELWRSASPQAIRANNLCKIKSLITNLNSKNTDGFPFTFGSYGYRTPLHKAIRINRAENAIILSEIGCDINNISQNSSKSTPLHLAVMMQNRRKEIGCDINKMNSSKLKKKIKLRVLWGFCNNSKKADFNIKDGNGLTPLH